jgi:hypothetical protein
MIPTKEKNPTAQITSAGPPVRRPSFAHQPSCRSAPNPPQITARPPGLNYTARSSVCPPQIRRSAQNPPVRPPQITARLPGLNHVARSSARPPQIRPSSPNQPVRPKSPYVERQKLHSRFDELCLVAWFLILYLFS